MCLIENELWDLLSTYFESVIDVDLDKLEIVKMGNDSGLVEATVNFELASDLTEDEIRKHYDKAFETYVHYKYVKPNSCGEDCRGYRQHVSNASCVE